ncbi:MAG TPA: autotransporter-associated beta strand repeat-containing protein [Tepidisphaeraceae bacterium]|nr:autotransporter-associated beta strand repeat-containing protein [Tepidisphaeraceae bacterium]
MSMSLKSPAKHRSGTGANVVSSKATSQTRIALATIAALSIAAAVPSSASAADGTWNVDANGVWSLDTNWLDSIVADGADSTANFVYNITGGRTVSLDSSRTIGNLKFQDITSVNNDWTLTSGPIAGNVLTLDTTAGVPQINVVNRTANVNLVLAGNDGVEKLGTGTLLLRAANTYTGGTTISAGTLIVANNLALSTSDITLGNAKLEGNNSFGTTYALSNAINVTSANSRLGSGDNGTLRLDGPISIPTDMKLAADGRNGPVVINGQISGAGEFLVNAGRATLNSVNTVSKVSQAAGTLFIGNDGALGSGVFTLAQRDASATIASSNSTGRTIANGFVLNGKAPFNTNNYNTTFGEAAGGTGALTFTGNGSISSMRMVVHTTAEFTGSVSGTAAVNMAVGNGTLILSGDNTFGGSITVNAAKLLVNNTTGSGTGTATINVGGGTLGGDGAIAGAVNVTGGTLSPGNSPGQLTVGPLSLGSGATTLMEIGGATLGEDYDNLTSTGNVTYGGTLNIVSIDGFDLTQTGIYDLFSFITSTGGFNAVTLDAMALTNIGGIWTGASESTIFTFTESTGDLVVAAAVPEPASIAVLGLAGLAALRRRRR